MALKERQREHTVQLLLEAAGRAFGEQGYHGTSMEEIARRAGCGTGTLYGYFKGKSEIFLRLINDFTEEFLEGVEAAVDGAPDFEQALGSYLNHIRRIAERERPVLSLLMSVFQAHETDALPAPEAMRRNEERHVAKLVQLMRRGLDEGSLAPGDERIYALGLLGTVHTNLYGWILGVSEPQLETILEACGRLFMDGARSRGETQ
jgi:AcrR family transcriptional regulator